MRLLTIAAGRRSKWIVVAVWLVASVAIVFAGLPAQFEDKQKNESADYLPGKADSRKGLDLQKRQSGGEINPGIVVYNRASGLTRLDKTAIAADKQRLSTRPLVGQLGEPSVVFARNGRTATLQFQVRATGDSKILLDNFDRLEKTVRGDSPDGLTVKVTGGFGFSKDAVKVFEQMNATTVLGAGIVVIILLLLIYRSPILWLLPLIGVVFAEIVSRAIGAGIIEAGITVNGQSAIMMTILVFGVGTDYGLLLLARYREELRRYEDRHEAMEFALRRSIPPILASAATVTAALLCLSLAEMNSTASMGPIAAIGVVTAMLSMLTAFPALLLIAGRVSFWPRIPHFRDREHFASGGLWSRVTDVVQSHGRMVSGGVFALMAVMALGLTTYSTNLTQLDIFSEPVESVEGQRLLAGALPPGATGPLTVVFEQRPDAERIRRTVERTPGVALVTPITTAHGVSSVDATLESEPYGRPAEATVKRLRASLPGSRGESPVFVTGPAAFDVDSKHFAGRDNKLLMPLVIVVVFLILVALLRSIVAPVALMLTVIASYFAALGFSIWVFDALFGYPGVGAEFPLFVFVFLVALGVDYNIFLMARVREEAQIVGTAEGIRRGLIATGGVITSAAVVLAGTFSVLAFLPLVFITEVGFAVAFGVLFDALLIRSIVVPAIGFELGPRLWWPSALTRRP